MAYFRRRSKRSSHHSLPGKNGRLGPYWNKMTVDPLADTAAMIQKRRRSETNKMSVDEMSVDPLADAAAMAVTETPREWPICASYRDDPSSRCQMENKFLNINCNSPRSNWITSVITRAVFCVFLRVEKVNAFFNCIQCFPSTKGRKHYFRIGINITIGSQQHV